MEPSLPEAASARFQAATLGTPVATVGGSESPPRLARREAARALTPDPLLPIVTDSYPESN